LIDLTDTVIHALLVAFSALVLATSLLAYRIRRNSRYLFLSLAFAFLAASEIVALVEVLFYSAELIVIPSTGIHLSHFLEFLMLSSFSIALLIKNKGVPSADQL